MRTYVTQVKAAGVANQQQQQRTAKKIYIILDTSAYLVFVICCQWQHLEKDIKYKHVLPLQRNIFNFISLYRGPDSILLFNYKYIMGYEMNTPNSRT